MTAGYFSKDAIIESAFVAHNAVSMEAFYILVFAAFLTSFYSWRLIFMTFHGRSRATPDVLSHVHESPKVMLIPLALLAVGALLAGLVFKGMFFGDGYASFWGESLFTSKDNHIVHEIHNVPLWVKYSPLMAMITGFVFAWVCYIAAPSVPAAFAKVFEPIYLFFLNKWYFDELYDYVFVKPAKWLGRVLWKIGDGKIIDGFGPDGIAKRVQNITGKVKSMQTGYVYHYAFVMMIGLTMMVTYFIVRGGI